LNTTVLIISSGVASKISRCVRRAIWAMTTLIELAYFCHRPGYRLNDLAGLDVPERFLWRDDVGRGQVPLDCQQGGFGDIAGAALDRETRGVGGPVQDYLYVLADGIPVVLAEPGLHFLDMGVVGSHLAPCVGNLLVMRLACCSDLPVPLGFAVEVIGLGPAEFFPGCLAGGLIPLLAAEHPPESSRRVRFELRPLRLRRGDREPAEVQRRNLDVAPQGGQADPGISRQRRSQQVRSTSRVLASASVSLAAASFARRSRSCALRGCSARLAACCISRCSAAHSRYEPDELE
jgi:hypothetical protein